MKKIKFLFNTVKFLKPVQVYYRLYYVVRRRIRKVTGFTYPFSVTSKPEVLTLEPSISSYASLAGNTFTFLNFSHTFEKGIDWNYSEFGKLWTYNLTYFDYLQQEGISKEQGTRLMYDFIVQAERHKDAMEPFPISLRGINWIKFLTQHQIKDQTIDDSLYAQYQVLIDNLEYHLLGNHLLENGFSLLFGAYYFKDENFYAKAKEILIKELDEQILNDGAHFELSPMYHQVMLFRVLDCLNLLQNNQWREKDMLTSLLKKKTEKMLNWLNAVTFEDGSIPLLNDSAKGIAPATEQLNAYTLYLIPASLQLSSSTLTESGYRKYKTSKYECIIDIGSIGPDYIPGHAHADTFNFELYVKGKPFIVDTGLSTYETNAKRTAERSTSAHNTVEVNKMNSSEVWGGFRVANRANVIKLLESDGQIVGTHDGYLKKFGILHTRRWQFEENKIIIDDSLNKAGNAVARFHFHPEVTEEMIHEHIAVTGQDRISKGGGQLSISSYRYAPEFNKSKDALVLEIPFEKKLTVEILL